MPAIQSSKQSVINGFTPYPATSPTNASRNISISSSDATTASISSIKYQSLEDSIKRCRISTQRRTFIFTKEDFEDARASHLINCTNSCCLCSSIEYKNLQSYQHENNNIYDHQTVYFTKPEVNLAKHKLCGYCDIDWCSGRLPFYDSNSTAFAHHMKNVHGFFNDGSIAQQPKIGTLRKLNNSSYKNTIAVCPYNKTDGSKCSAKIDLNFSDSCTPFKAYFRHCASYHRCRSPKIDEINKSIDSSVEYLEEIDNKVEVQNLEPINDIESFLNTMTNLDVETPETAKVQTHDIKVNNNDDMNYVLADSEIDLSMFNFDEETAYEQSENVEPIPDLDFSFENITSDSDLDLELLGSEIQLQVLEIESNVPEVNEKSLNESLESFELFTQNFDDFLNNYQMTFSSSIQSPIF